MSLSKEMQAAQLCEFNKPYELRRVKVPEVGETDLLVKVHAAGFCHSDLQVIHGQFGTQLPLIPSHEPAGTVVQVGRACQAKDEWNVGDRVGILNFKNACGRCPGCALSKRQQGGSLDPRFCEAREMAGFKHDGAFAEYMVADPTTTVKLPDAVSFEQAAPLMCAGATVWGALEKATERLAPGETIAIIGIGGLGHLGVQFGKAMGYRVVAIDNRPEGRQLATQVSNPELCPDLIIDSSTPATAAAEIYEFTSGEGLAATVVCTDSLAANDWALTLLRIGGVSVLLGLPPNKWRFDSSVIVFRELTLRGSYVASRESTQRMMAVVEQHKVESHLTVLPLGEVARVTELYQDKSFSGRLVIQIAET
ncbi:alcohol dehydrogenase GroES-like domain-containing protein [Xylariales sp. PMI_506]|nr:alcohol dehydrogenase GroES-like domain-containing protein [Xylariales sp. PMI_506]